jgi:intraflagellar transport protein 46
MKNPRPINNWIESVYDIQSKKSTPVLNFGKMPDLELLMQEWPTDIELYLDEHELMFEKMDLNTNELTKLMVALLDIPVNPGCGKRSLIHATHAIFALYSEFQNSDHFKRRTKTGLDVDFYRNGGSQNNESNQNQQLF